ncbi:MAG: hypothetical protein ACREDR_20115, partial [Blastocatellia bacterium]
MRTTRVFLLMIGAAATVAVISPARMHAGQSQTFTLTGAWTVHSQPINGATLSRMGNTLGFPVRHMVFAEDGNIRTGLVDREDIGPNVKPLGDWRVEGNKLSASFELWCPDPTQACG